MIRYRGRRKGGRYIIPLMDPDPAEVERHYREWRELMDFGWEFFLQASPQLCPGEDPIQRLRDAWEAKGREHMAANERMVAGLGRARHGR